MPCYVCEKCGCIDNTALGGNYWLRLFKITKTATIAETNPVSALCCECYKGKWHNQFPKKFITDAEFADAPLNGLLNPDVAKRFIEANKTKGV